MSQAAAAPSGSRQVRLMQVILAPVISEKSTFISDKNNQYVFRVIADATKQEIKAAIEAHVQPEGEAGGDISAGSQRPRQG